MKKFTYLLFFVIMTAQAQKRAFIVPKDEKISVPEGTERRLALVIGNNAYKPTGKKLKNPINDANAMAAVLEKKLGFKVILKTDLTKAKMLKEIDDFGNKLANYDVGLLYYAGHGMQFEGENYLVPIDAEIQMDKDVESKNIKLSKILREFESSKIKTSIIFLDACQTNPFTNSHSKFVKPNNPPGSVVVFTTDEGSTVDDNQIEKNGLFTGELLKNIEKSNVNLQQILTNTRIAVYEKSNHSQLPISSDKILVDFYFIKPNLSTLQANAIKRKIDSLEKKLNDFSVIQIKIEKAELRKLERKDYLRGLLSLDNNRFFDGEHADAGLAGYSYGRFNANPLFFDNNQKINFHSINIIDHLSINVYKFFNLRVDLWKIAFVSRTFLENKNLVNGSMDLKTGYYEVRQQTKIGIGPEIFLNILDEDDGPLILRGYYVINPMFYGLYYQESNKAKADGYNTLYQGGSPKYFSFKNSLVAHTVGIGLTFPSFSINYSVLFNKQIPVEYQMMRYPMHTFGISARISDDN